MHYQSISLQSASTDWEPFKREKTLKEMLVRYYIWWLKTT